MDRTNLSKMTLAGKQPAAQLFAGEDGDALRVKRVTSAVERIDLPATEGQRGRVLTSKGERIEFDSALLATGGAPKKLGISGEDLPHVHMIRHVADVESIGATIAERAITREGTPVRAVILGDSFIAFEAASALKQRGLAVTVVAREKAPFAKRFTPAIALAITDLHRKNGVVVKTGVEANGITEAVVTLTGGEALPAELVIVAVGVEPATGFGHGFALEKDGSVAVGRDLRAAERVWVAGDIATVDGARIEHWRLAEQHGRTAGKAMLRAAGALVPVEEANYHGVPFFWTFHFGKRFGYVGHAETWDAVVVDGYIAEHTFVAFFIKNSMLQAAMGCGRDSAIALLAERMREPMTFDEARIAVDEQRQRSAGTGG